MKATTAKRQLSILFVCMGNICRSPTAEAVFRKLAPSLAPELTFEIDSAGTHRYHIGAPPDERSQRAALDQGIDMSGLRARQLEARDFDRFDWIVFMDETNRRDARRLSQPNARARLVRLLDFAPDQPLRDVPDPYYGEAAGFAQVVGLIDSGVRGFIAALRN